MIYGSEERFWVIASMAVVDLEMITLREEGLRKVFCNDSETILNGFGLESGLRNVGRDLHRFAHILKKVVARAFGKHLAK